MANAIMPLGSFTSTSPAEERRFLRITGVTLALFLIVSVVIPLIPIPELSEAPPRALPPRLARLQLERETPKPPEPEPVQEPEEQAEPEAPPEPEPAPPQPAPEPEPAPPEPVPPRETAREQAARSGLLAFKDQLADLREKAPTQALSEQTLTEGGDPAATPQADTNRLVGDARQTSGGIQGVQGPTSQQVLGGRDTTRVDRASGSGGRATSGRRDRDTGGRSLASIQAVFDRHKGVLYTLYNRALRRDPSLEGRLVIKLTIAPTGNVTDIRLVSSGLDNEHLVRQIIDRIKLFDFGEADVKPTTLEYPLDFMPS